MNKDVWVDKYRELSSEEKCLKFVILEFGKRRLDLCKEEKEVSDRIESLKKSLKGESQEGQF